MSNFRPLQPLPSPSRGTRDKQAWRFVIAFAIIGLTLLITILLLGGIIDSIGKAMTAFGGRIFPEAFAGSIIAVLVGAVQSVILRDALRRSNIAWFILAALAGGFVGGLVIGLIENLTGIFSSFTTGMVLGATMGALAGAVSSLIQNLFMKSEEEKRGWVLYSAVSWCLVWAIGAGIGWSISGTVGLAITGALIMIGSGVSLALYLPRTHIEF